MALFRRPAPDEIFTPRATDVNADMYVERGTLESQFKRAARGSQHILLFGDSGSGKSWLYKKYFRENKVKYRIVDLALARMSGLEAALLKCIPPEEWKEIEKTEEAANKLSAVVVGAGERRQTRYQKQEEETLQRVLSNLASRSGHSNFLVFDNFEQISTNTDLIDEIMTLVMRLDSEDFSQHNVRFLIVGAISDMKELIARRDSVSTLANRIREVPEVERLTREESDELVRRGLKDKLRIKIVQEQVVLEQIYDVTYGMAQQVHELCYEIACEAEDTDWQVNVDVFRRAKESWIAGSLSTFRAQVQSRLNVRDTRVQRRNQVIYSLGAFEGRVYRVADIDEHIRRHFPDTIPATQLGVDQIMASLASGINPILVRNPNENSFRLQHPKLKLTIRAMMSIDADGQLIVDTV